MNSVVPTDLGWIAHPLDEFYTRSRLTLPPLEQVDGEEVPEPYRSLLVHRHDMTSTLENFHGDKVQIHVLGRERRDGLYYREVVLKLEGSGKPVEFGAIKIDLNLFPAQAQEWILAERWPLGRILRECDLAYASTPKAFLRVASDKLINTALDLTGAQVLYGRRNTLLDKNERSLAEIVEILPRESRKKPAA